MLKTNRPSKPCYDAFISYSHNADAKLSMVLQNGLQKFAKAWYRRRSLHIFRDATALLPDAPLSVAIESAIDQSRYLILLASTEAATSPWVQRELEIWLSKHGVNRLLLVLTDGTLNWSEKKTDFDQEFSSALPQPLFGAFEAEPLFVDLRGVRTGASSARNDARFRDAVATLSAVIQHRAKGDLVGEDLAQHRRTLRLAWGAAGLFSMLALATTIASIRAIQQRDLAEARETVARAGQLAADASRLLHEQPVQLELATLLAIESVKRAPSGNGQRALAAATKLLPARVAESYAGHVYKLAFSPNKRWLARGDDQLGVILWDLQAGKFIQLSMAAQVRDLQFSIDGKWLAIAGGSSDARVVDLPDGKYEWVFNHNATVLTVAFDPAGRRLATGAKDGHLRVWDIATQSLLLDEQMSSVDDVRVTSFNHDGSLLGAVSSNGPIRLYTTDNWERVELEWVTPGEGLALDFSPDGAFFAVTRANRAVIWTVDDGRVISTIEHSDYTSDTNMDFETHIWDLEFSPDSSLLVTSGRDGTVRFSRPQSGEEVLRLNHNTSVEDTIFTVDGDHIVTASYNLVQLWSLPDGKEVLRVAPTGGGKAIALSHDGSLIATGGPESSVRVMRTKNAVTAKQFNHIDDVMGVACHPNKPLIATADDKHNVQVWDAATESILVHTKLLGARQLSFTAKDELYIAAESVMSRMDTAGLVHKVSPVLARNFALHSDYVAARIKGGLILIWSTLGGSEPLKIDAGAHNDINFNENASLMISQRFFNSQGTAHLWDVRTGEEVWTIRLDLAFGNTIAADSAGDTLAVANESNLTLINRSENSVRKLEFGDRVRALLFFEDSSKLAVLVNRDLVVLDVANLDAVPLSFKHDSNIRFLAFNKDRSLVASTTGHSVSVWDLETGTKLADWSTDARVSQMCFLAGDEALVLGDDANHVTIQPWRTTDLVDAACTGLTRNMTEKEWIAYLPGVSYKTTCLDLQPLSREVLLEEMNPRSPLDSPD